MKGFVRGVLVLGLGLSLVGCLPTGSNGGGGGTSNCEDDEVRARPAGLPRACYPICESQADCSGLTACLEVNGGNDLACLPAAENNISTNNTPGCTSNADCTGDSPICSPSGVCVDEGDPCASVVCEVGSTCIGGECVEVSDNNPTGCTSDSQCGADEFCDNGTCVFEGGDECEFNSQCSSIEICDDGRCVRNPEVDCLSNRDCGDGEFCNGDNQCEAEFNEVAALCESFCSNVYGSCPKSQCGGLTASDRSDADRNYDICVNGGSTNGQTQDACEVLYARDSEYRQSVDTLGSQNCGSSELRDVHCYALGYGDKCGGCTGWNAGDPCTSDNQCDAGLLQASCVPEIDPNTGDPTGFEGGYCIGVGCNTNSNQVGQIAYGPQTGCGNDALCLNEDDGNGGVTGVCVGLCSGAGTCRVGYDCQEAATLQDGTSLGVCFPQQ